MLLAYEEGWHIHAQLVVVGLRPNVTQVKELKHGIIPELGLLAAPTTIDSAKKAYCHACHHPGPVGPTVTYDPDHLPCPYVEVAATSEIGLSKDNPF